MANEGYADRSDRDAARAETGGHGVVHKAASPEAAAGTQDRAARARAATAGDDRGAARSSREDEWPLMAALPAPAAPAAPAGASAAQTSLYYATAAELAHAYEHTLASDQEALSDDQASFRANQGKLNATEPTAMTNVRNRANEEGLATSGIEGQRADQQQASFARAMGALTTTREQDTSKINRGMTEAGESYADKIKTNLADRESEVQKEAQANAEKNPTAGSTATTPTAPVNHEPGTVAHINRAGNEVVEKAAVRPPTITKATPQPNTSAIRKAAAKKVSAG